MRIVVTGAAGFIGYHLCKRLLKEGDVVTGLDNLNDYYDVSLKQARLARLSRKPEFHFERITLENRTDVTNLFAKHRPEVVVNLAAQAGVRYSINNPHAYVDSNIVGFLNVLEASRHYHVQHFVYASSSSVYGANTTLPFSVHQNVDHPLSLYAATKRANELIAHTYSHLFGLPTTGLRFFTVYGPWGRPDMCMFLFTKALFEGRTISVYNNGDMLRDFTYVDDVVEAVARIASRPPTGDAQWVGCSPDPGNSSAPYRLYNVGSNSPVHLMEVIRLLEKNTGRRAVIELLPMQPGDVPATFADVDDLVAEIGFKPMTAIDEGISRFVDWYHGFYGENTARPAVRVTTSRVTMS